MSCWLLAEKEEDYYRSIVYFTLHSNFAVIAREKKTTNVEYEFVDSTVLPKKFLPLLNNLAAPPPASETDSLTTGGYYTRVGAAIVEELDRDKLPIYMKKLFYNADLDAIPFTDNQEGYFQYVEEVCWLWGIEYSPQSPYPTSNPFKDDEKTLHIPQSPYPTSNPFKDDEETLMETPVVIKTNRKRPSTTPTGGNNNHSDSPSLFDDIFNTPDNHETPGNRKCLAPKKLKEEEF